MQNQLANDEKIKGPGGVAQHRILRDVFLDRVLVLYNHLDAAIPAPPFLCVVGGYRGAGS